MSTYAIGDIQGCFRSFQQVLDKIQFTPQTDQLWLVGDIVNRGTGSLEMLRWAYQHQSSIKMVLGNHDLHAITVAEGLAKVQRGDTLQDILDAPDRAALLTWLRQQPLLHTDGNFVMVHAGLLPQWSIAQSQSLATEVESALRAPNYRDFLSNMYGNQPTLWRDDLMGANRLRIITNAMTRMRICSPSGEMEFKHKGELADIPEGWLPWFEVPNRLSADHTIICGHWSALGLKLSHNICALDTGCFWGGQLTALNLENRQIVQVPCDECDTPKHTNSALN
jgi:bis(5'-nucleosyl)-tetraphosphatase (symmetrical)